MSEDESKASETAGKPTPGASVESSTPAQAAALVGSNSTKARARGSKRTATPVLTVPAMPALVLEDIVSAPGPVKIFLDANILIPQYLRAVFLDLASAGEVRPYWTEHVLVETRRNLVRESAYDMDPQKVDELLQLINTAFPDALVQGYERHEMAFVGKTDWKDEHVAAGALKVSLAVYSGQPVALVTSNAADLPQRAFEGTQVLMVRPDRFLTALLQARPGGVTAAMSRMLSRFKTPHVTREAFLEVLARAGCAQFANALGQEWGLQLIEQAKVRSKPPEKTSANAKAKKKP